jgi:fatty-acyl-CoA synthase
MQGLMQDVPLTLQLALQRAGELYGSKVVATKTAEGVRTRTFAEVVDRTTRLASALADLGIRGDDRVATFGWNTDRHLELYLAVPCMGAILHTLNIRLHPDQVAWIANHAEDRAVFVDASLAEAWGAIPAVGTIRTVVGMDDGPGVPDGMTDYEALLDEQQAAAMCYTSGTTGDPKGVVYSHRSSTLHALATLYADTLAISERDVVMPIVPQFHANAWGTVYAALMTGASLAMPGRFMDPESVAALVESQGVTISAAVPTVWFGVLQAIRAGQLDPARLSSLERIVVGGSAVPEALMRGYDELGIRIVHAWGMTETSPLGTVATVKSTVAEDEVLRTRLTQGLPSPGLRLRIIDDDGAEAAWDGEAMGELQITGPWIAEAYYDPAAEGNRGGLDRFADGDDGTRWLKTGDVATIDAEGYVTLVDRTKDLVKSGGEWISTVQLENLLIAHPKVVEAAVIAVPDPKWDERPLAYVVKGDDTVTEAELLDHLAEHVARWQVPDGVVFIDEVPKTSVGKFDKKVLRAQFGRGAPHGQDRGAPPPGTPRDQAGSGDPAGSGTPRDQAGSGGSGGGASA